MFKDRTDAGRRLAAELLRLKDRAPVVLGQPRGGVAVAYEVAEALDAPLDLVLVRKIGAPMQPELAVGAVVDGSRPETVVHRDVADALGVPAAYIEEEAARQLAEIERRRELYLAGRAPVDIAGRTAIVVDDGIATGATVEAALLALRRARPAHLVLAVPVAPADTVARLRAEVDEAVCLATPRGFGAISVYYDDFHQMSDAEVVELLRRSAARRAPDGQGSHGPPPPRQG